MGNLPVPNKGHHRTKFNHTFQDEKDDFQLYVRKHQIAIGSSERKAEIKCRCPIPV